MVRDGLLVVIFGLALAGCPSSSDALEPQATEGQSATDATDARASDATTSETFDDDRDDATTDAPLPDEAWQLSVYSGRATRIEAWIYADPRGAEPALVVPLEPSGAGDWQVTVQPESLADAGVETIYYGLRAWGPNWPYRPDWAPGSELGFVADVDEAGNRFNPNKLLFDPYARELSHDPQSLEHGGHAVYTSGPDFRTLDSGPRAPKGIVLADPSPMPPGPLRPLAEDIVYEVHVRGFTRSDPAVEEACRGTYAGAARKAEYLAELGFTAIEFLPIHETDNDRNDFEEGTAGDNYWGYSTLSYFAPDRRYACDRTPGGPTREFREMVQAFHDVGIKVFLDVVYNHTGETGTWGNAQTASLFSWRGLDNDAYYQLTSDGRGYVDNSGVGGNLDVTQPAARALVMASLRYAHDILGVDGFRFDLASILGNACTVDCFEFNPSGLLTEIAVEFARPPEGGPGVDLLAEPWGIGLGTYQLGNFPAGWAEWNGQYRDMFRRHQNRHGMNGITPRELIRRFSGSPDLFNDGRTAASSVNFLVAHDGFTLHDLYSCFDKHNDQPWPFGPSDGGADENHGFDWGEPAMRRQMARAGVAWLMLSAGVPMLNGGDEFLRTLRCNNNAYNLDSEANWLDWGRTQVEAEFMEFVRGAIALRKRHASMTHDSSFLGDARWLDEAAVELGDGYLDDASRHFVAMHREVEGIPEEPARAIYVAYNGWTQGIDVTLPPPPEGAQWHVALDSALGATWTSAEGPVVSSYTLTARSILAATAY